jgi:isopentenyl diphosphate isomerase/L-lactate dehydrogenase-like FMN-dependent dehydrogenase
VTQIEPSVDLRRIVRLSEFEPLGRAAMETSAYDYVAGGAWDELSLGEAEEAWRRRRLRPRVLVDVSRVDPATTMAAVRVPIPVAIAPMAAHGLAHPDAEVATARAAAAVGIPFAASTMSTRSLEEIAAAAPTGARWFQLYAQSDPRESRRLVERAEAAGYGAILVTVDLPVLGYRERDLRSGWTFAVPLGNFRADAPGDADQASVGTSGYDVISEQVDTGLVWADIAEIRSWTRLPVFLKGILTTEDASLAVEAGVDGIVVSNHGARQLDRTVATADALEGIAAAVDGRVEIWVDGGIRRGLDVVTAIALGASGVLVGRPILWALAAAGEAGVLRALEILDRETRLAMMLLGTPTIGAIHRSHIAD